MKENTTQQSRKWTGYSSAKLESVSTKITKACETYISITRNAYVKFTHEKVYINDKDFLYTISCIPEKETRSDSPIVLCNGYGVGCLLYINFMVELCILTNRTVYAFDWQGTAGSSRPKFNPKNTAAAVKYFLDSFELWRAKMNFEKMDLFGHSLGAYLVARYAGTHPERINKLFLLSPAGVNDHYPKDVEKAAINSGDAQSNPMMKSPWRAKIFIFMNTTLWNWNVVPQHIITMSGPLSKLLTNTAVWKLVRFGGRHVSLYGLSENDETKDLAADYLHQIAVTPLCAEKCLNFILGPGAFGRDALKDYLYDVKYFPVHFYYGTNDWMDVRCGEETVAKMKDNNENVSLTKVPDSGHQLFIENPVFLAVDVANKL